jgi:F-type H+-transporting ATPase subunit c
MLMLAQAAEAVSGSGSLNVAAAAIGAALAIGFIGAKAVEAIGRNPGAFPKVLTMAILASALAEAIVFYALFIKGV